MNNNKLSSLDGRTIRELIEELKTFENQELEVRLSIDDLVSNKPISIVGKNNNYCMLVYCNDV